MDPYSLITKYYPVGSDLYELLVAHGRSVAGKALAIARAHAEMDFDLDFVHEAALLHDIGIYLCHAPDIGCYGKAPYICHGYLGAELLRREGLPRHALVCERHTGAGITLRMIEELNMPLPRRDLLPVSPEEQLICFADKFFSKTEPRMEKPLAKVRRGLARYGAEGVERFDAWCKLFLEG
jgi:uncharacterized protein